MSDMLKQPRSRSFVPALCAVAAASSLLAAAPGCNKAGETTVAQPTQPTATASGTPVTAPPAAQQTRPAPDPGADQGSRAAAFRAAKEKAEGR